jgi:hypothetical protein
MKKMSSEDNPWESMPRSSQRRVSSDMPHDVYWMTDTEGKYGFCLKIPNSFDDGLSIPNLKGISTLKRNSAEGFGELFLILNDKDDWEIFNVLCNDLINTALQCGIDEEIIDAVEIRLRRWHLLLKRERQKELTLEVQMGLFSELLCLRDSIAPRVGIKQASISWVGPNFDKQDFLLENSAVEVKSYRTSRGPVVEISSAKQLSSEKESLYLLTYGLTNSDTGSTVEDLAKSISAMLSAESAGALDAFESKLMSYGYIPEMVKEPLIKFKLDRNRAYVITDDFPKINPQDLKAQIISVNYSIDLTLCAEFEVEFNSITF